VPAAGLRRALISETQFLEGPMANSDASSTETRTGFGALTGLGKLKFIGKALTFVATFGFAFPTLFGE
jgi:hypothetical protein